VRQDIGYGLKQRLREGKRAFGPLIGPGNDPEPTVEAIREIGYDYFMIDNEHSLVGLFFPPIGHRGSGIGMSPYLLDGMDVTTTPLAAMTEYANHNMLLFPQTESLTAVKNLSHILALEGVAGTIVGTNDLALDIGDYRSDMLRPTINSQPCIEERLYEVLEACRTAGKVAGVGGFTPKGCVKWAHEGFQFFTLGYVRDNNVQRLKPVLDEARSLIG